jgi:hypothetical protein
LKKYQKALIHILLPLTAGVLVYILFREPETPLHQWLGIKQKIVTTITLPPYLLFQFSDACWAYALCASLLLLTSFSKPWAATFSLIYLSLVEFQQAKWIISRLDWPDLITMTIAVFLALVLIRRK